MVSFTSEADTALSEKFPIGMQLYYNAELTQSSNKDLIKTPYGLYKAYSNCRLEIKPDSTVESALTKDAFTRAVRTWCPFRRGERAFEIGGIALKHAPSVGGPRWTPVLNILVAKDTSKGTTKYGIRSLLTSSGGW